jgi:hypothetical protein
MSLLIGLQLYQADDAVMRRQLRALEALRALDGVDAVNVQFRCGDSFTDPSIETAAVLERDSVGVTGVEGRRRPLTREMFDRLAAAAARRGREYFAFINSDIIVTPAAIETIRRGARDTYALSRADVRWPASGAMEVSPVMTSGLDMFVARVSWWQRHGHRFRDYIIGEACWDNVFAAILMCHSDGLILNREPLILHEWHAAVWRDETPAARFNGMLAAFDARYFSLWAQYWQRLEQARAAGWSEPDELALCREMFVWRRSLPEAVRQVARTIRARQRFAHLKAGWTTAAARG